MIPIKNVYSEEISYSIKNPHQIALVSLGNFVEDNVLYMATTSLQSFFSHNHT